MSEAPRARVLMTGAGAPGGPGIIKSLRDDARVDLITGDVDGRAAGRRLSNNFVELPPACDERFIGQMHEICKMHGIQVIFPLVTRELLKLSQAVESFSALGVKVLVSPYQSLCVANDKIALYQHLASHGVALPDHRVARDVSGLRAAAAALGYPARPVVIKPGASNGSRGMRILDESRDRFDLLFGEKPTAAYSTLGQIEAAIGSRAIPPMLVSEYLPGDELTVDTIVSAGVVKILLIRTRDRTNGGISTAGRFVDDERVANYCRAVLGTMELAGPIGLQVKRSVTGDYRLLEINPRIQGTSVAALGLGINLPLLALSEAMSWECAYPTRRSGIGFVRYYEEAFYESE